MQGSDLYLLFGKGNPVMQSCMVGVQGSEENR
jgi:hypothetical protein